MIGRSLLAMVVSVSCVVGCGRATPAPQFVAPQPAAGEMAAPPTGAPATPATEVVAPVVPIVRVAAVADSERPVVANARPAGEAEDAARALAWQRLGLRLPPSHASQLLDLGPDGKADDAGVLLVGPMGLRVDGAEVGGVVCRTAAGPCAPGVVPSDATLRLPLDDLLAQGDGTVHRGVVNALGRRWRGKTVWLLLDQRLTGWASLQLLQSVAAAGARPVLAGLAGPGQAVRHWPDEPPADELPAGAAVPGAEAVPADVYAVVLELNADGAAVVLAREGGGMMRRPCGLDPARCAARVASVVAARPDLATLTLDFGPAVSLGMLAAWVEALRDPCVRDVDGNCVAERSAAIAVLWVRRGGAEWTDGDGDPARAGEPPVPVRLPELRPRLPARPGAIDGEGRVPTVPSGAPAIGAIAPSAAGAGLDLRGLSAPPVTR